jgi:hypothetical protein
MLRGQPCTALKICGSISTCGDHQQVLDACKAHCCTVAVKLGVLACSAAACVSPRQISVLNRVALLLMVVHVLLCHKLM